MKKVRITLTIIIGFISVTLAIASNKHTLITLYYYANSDNTGEVFPILVDSPCIIGGIGCIIPTEIGERQLYVAKISKYIADGPLRH
ncbi:hypothetical protein [Chitinophaga sp. MM2321]|uniref:hypothetical protein n=1 Tax=Chitinophaga sp. MM2321 TaxID=3137178 RepID=UPI0032D5AFA5